MFFPRNLPPIYPILPRLKWIGPLNDSFQEGLLKRSERSINKKEHRQWRQRFMGRLSEDCRVTLM